MSGLGDHGHVVRDRDRWIPGSPAVGLSPRCGKPMLRYEAANGPMPEQPECARPEGHAGMCRSGAALARKYAADKTRIYALRAQGQRYGRSAGWPARRAAA